MATYTNTYVSYDVTGTREDLHEFVSNITPNDMFFYKELGSRDVKQRKHEHMTDALDAVDTSNAQVEGDTFSSAALTAATKIYNMCQILSKTFTISESNLAEVAAGNVNSEEYQTIKASKALGRDREHFFFSGVRDDGALATARQMRGALNWVTTNIDKAGDATLNADGTITGGTSRDLTRAMVKNLCQNIWTSGGEPKEFICGAFQATKITDMAGTGVYRWMVEKAKLNDVIDVYVNEFGTFRVRKHTLVPTDILFACDKEKWKKGTLRKTRKKYGNPGKDGTEVDLRCEETIISVNEAASGRITNLTTS